MKKYSYMLRTSDKDGTSYNGFQWPAKGHVEDPDFNPDPICGYGLHGLLNGEGNSDFLDWSDDALWQVVRILTSDIIELGGKIKVPKGEVIYSGDRCGTTALLAKKIGIGYAIHGATIVAGNYGTAVAGDYGKATAGYKGTATVGNHGTAAAGDYGKATARDYGKAIAGNYGKATARDYGKAIAGNYGTAAARWGGNATVGDYGKATAGYKGAAVAGDYGKAIAGYEGIVSAGQNGILICQWWHNGPQSKSFKDFKPNVRYKFECKENNCELIEMED